MWALDLSHRCQLFLDVAQIQGQRRRLGVFGGHFWWLKPTWFYHGWFPRQDSPWVFWIKITSKTIETRMTEIHYKTAFSSWVSTSCTTTPRFWDFGDVQCGHLCAAPSDDVLSRSWSLWANLMCTDSKRLVIGRRPTWLTVCCSFTWPNPCNSWIANAWNVKWTLSKPQTLQVFHPKRLKKILFPSFQSNFHTELGDIHQFLLHFCLRLHQVLGAPRTVMKTYKSIREQERCWNMGWTNGVFQQTWCWWNIFEEWWSVARRC